jgi:hypothetical protein
LDDDACSVPAAVALVEPTVSPAEADAAHQRVVEDLFSDLANVPETAQQAGLPVGGLAALVLTYWLAGKDSNARRTRHGRSRTPLSFPV